MAIRATVQLIVWMMVAVGVTCAPMTVQAQGERIPFEALRVVPSGQNVGIRVQTEGVLVAAVEHNDSVLQQGDRLVRINGQTIETMGQLTAIVRSWRPRDESLQVTYVRAGVRHEAKVRPYYDAQRQFFRLGVRLRDTIVGIGTVTYYVSNGRGERVYGALGHAVTEPDTQSVAVSRSGEIIRSSVTAITKSQEGVPGEKRAVLLEQAAVLGHISGNGTFGIYGKVAQEQSLQTLIHRPVPVARAEDVKEGPAEMYTVVEGQTIERFQVRIMHVEGQLHPATKGFVVQVEDERLLRRTGGIVQGMSGSPIVQDGRLIGAVTHVFVNNPRNGYGCFAEWMVQQAGLISKKPPSTQGGISRAMPAELAKLTG